MDTPCGTHPKPQSQFLNQLQAGNPIMAALTGSSTSNTGASPADEREAVRQLLAGMKGAEIVTDTSEILSMRLGHSLATRYNLRLQFPADYPSTPILVECNSTAFPLPLVRKLLKLANDAAASGAAKGQRHALEAVHAVTKFVQGNRFCACWKEVRQIVQVS